MVVNLLLAASFSLMNPVDWELGRFMSASNGLLSVTGHGGMNHARLTSSAYALVKGQNPVFEAETLLPKDYDGRHDAAFWFVCYDAAGKQLGKRPLNAVSDGSLPDGTDGWRRLRTELKDVPDGAVSVRVCSTCGASKYCSKPHTYLRNMRLSGVEELPDRPGARRVDVKDAADIRCAGTNTTWRLRFAKGGSLACGLAKTKTGYRFEPLGIDYAIGAPSNVLFAVRTTDARALFYLDGNYIGGFDGLGRLVAVSGLNAAEGAVVTQPKAAKVAPHCEYVDFGGYDLAKAAKKGEFLSSLKALTNSCVRTVPCEQYARAFVTCAVDPDPKKDRAFTIRLSRYNDTGNLWGRAFNGMAQTLVELDKAKKTKVGDLWRVEVPLGLGQIPDIVFTDRIGTHLQAFTRAGLGRYLDLELLGRCIAVRGGRFDERMKPDPKYTSAVTVYGVELEKPACELDFRQGQPGNVFEANEKAETTAILRVKRPGKYTLAWTVKDAEGRTVGGDSRTVSASAEIPVDFTRYGLGWYAVAFTLSCGKETLLKHEASFAKLPADTRQAEMGEEPYETWDYGGGHYTCADPKIVGPLLRKAGFRRSFGFQNNPVEVRRPYKVSPVIVLGNGGLDRKTDEQLIKEVRQKLRDDPLVRGCMIGHESIPWGYRMAPEMTGQPYDEKMVMGDKDKYEWATNRIEQAKAAAARIRRLFPELYITVGNSLGCTEYVGALLRNGFPHENADYMGLEVVQRMSLPERQYEASLQAADLMRETAKAFKCPWGVNGCFEQTYRNALLLGDDRQAAWYVRDLLLQQCWRFRDINIAILADVGNNYANGFWGTTGLMTRNPYHYPKKSYVAVATATRVLDQVVSAKSLPTGDPCVYFVEFALKGGRTAYAVWTTRGEAGVEFRASGDFEACDMYGRAFRPSGTLGNLLPGEKTYRLRATEQVCYLTSVAPVVTSAKVGPRRKFPQDAVPPDARVIARLDGSEKLALADGVEPLMERTTGVYMPYRTRGKYALRTVEDEEMGCCCELELAEPNGKLPVVVSEYAVAEFENPIPIEGCPKSIGMMVKGNSGWGQVYWVVEDKNGMRRISSGGYGADADCFDHPGTVSVTFTGWNFLQMPLCEESRINGREYGANLQWACGKRGPDGKFIVSGGAPAYPLKLVGVAFAAQNRPLFLTERRPHRQIVRFKDVTVFDR